MSFSLAKKKNKSNTKMVKKKMLNFVSVKVPAKLIFSGEHSVIYNSKAVVCAINIFLKIKIKRLKEPVIIIEDGENNFNINLNDLSLKHKNSNVILEIVRRFFNELKLSLCGMKITIKNSIPIGCGLGSSSALVAGMVFGLNELFGNKKSVSDLIKIATSIEDIFHGKSSGVDIRTIVTGGVIYVNRNSIKKISHKIDEMWIINTGKPSFSTKNVVMDVFNNFSSNDKIWHEMGEITSDISKIIASKEKIWQNIAYNENYLERLGVVKNDVVRFIDSLKKKGIYCKVCGAGTISKQEKNGGNGIVGIFQTLSKEQKKYLFTMCEKNNFSVKKINVLNVGLTICSK